MEIFEALEAMILVISEYFYQKSFDKKKTLRKRMPFLIIYIVSLFLIISGTTFLSFVLIYKKNQYFLGILLLLISILCIHLLLSPFLKKK